MSKIIWKTEKRKIGELKDTEYNPRILTKKQYKQLKKSLDKFDLVEIPAINKDNTIIAGHMRVAIFKKKYTENFEIDVRVPNRQLTKKEADEYLIRSNKNTGEWDFEKLVNNFELDELEEWGFEEKDFELLNYEDKLTGYDNKEQQSDNNEKKIICPKCGEEFFLQESENI